MFSRVGLRLRVEGQGRDARLIEDTAQQEAIWTISRLRGRMSLRGFAAVVDDRQNLKLSHEGVRTFLLVHVANERTVLPPERVGDCSRTHRPFVRLSKVIQA